MNTRTKHSFQCLVLWPQRPQWSGRWWTRCCKTVAVVIGASGPDLLCGCHQPLENCTNHQPSVSRRNHQPLVRCTNHQLLEIRTNHQPLVRCNSHQPLVGRTNHQPFVRCTNHQPVVRCTNHQPFVICTNYQPTFKPSCNHRRRRQSGSNIRNIWNCLPCDFMLMRSSDMCNSALERQGWYQPLGGCEDHRAVRSCVVAILSLGAAANMKLILCGINRPQSTYLPCLCFICGFIPPDNLSQKLNFSLLLRSLSSLVSDRSFERRLDGRVFRNYDKVDSCSHIAAQLSQLPL